jgi:hypothetical protein
MSEFRPQVTRVPSPSGARSHHASASPIPSKASDVRTASFSITSVISCRPRADIAVIGGPFHRVADARFRAGIDHLHLGIVVAPWRPFRKRLKRIHVFEHGLGRGVHHDLALDDDVSGQQIGRPARQHDQDDKPDQQISEKAHVGLPPRTTPWRSLSHRCLGAPDARSSGGTASAEIGQLAPVRTKWRTVPSKVSRFMSAISVQSPCSVSRPASTASATKG